ncbi:MAG: type II toxin-antitoxin system HicA family toxin [Candidatus Chisholmbacteria bacterium]|nr:type II toxin-antitoxin system HicA family toxin [Candidatus Chisholmbacteria bacterium]
MRAPKILKVLYKFGFRERNQTGSHLVLKSSTGHLVTIPVHPGRDVPKGTLRRIIKDAGLTEAQFLKLL